MRQEKVKLIKVTPEANDLLDKISEKRKSERSFIRTKQDIVTEAIQQLYKKEMK